MAKAPQTVDQGRRTFLRGELPGRRGPKPAVETHIASLVVQARPALLGAITDKIERLPGAEVHGSDPRGKLLVTFESDSQGQITDNLNRIHDIDGVITAALVFHQVDEPEPEVPEAQEEGRETS
ncbi:MAG: chaperone NapD [Pseudomonadota bacterium]